MNLHSIEKIPLNRRKFMVNRNFQLFDSTGDPSSAQDEFSSKTRPMLHERKQTTQKPSFTLSVHHKEGLNVDNGLKPLMALLKENRANEIHIRDPRTSLFIKGLENTFYKTRRPLHSRDVCQRFRMGTPIWIHFKTTCESSEEFSTAADNDLIDYTPTERLYYGYRGRLQREKLKLKQQKKNMSTNIESTMMNIRNNTPVSTICQLVSLGSFLDCGTFVAHASSLPDIDKFEVEFKCVPQSIVIRSIRNETYLNNENDSLCNEIIYALNIPHDHIESYLVLNHQNEYLDLFIPLLYSLKPVEEIQSDQTEIPLRRRSTRFHRFDKIHLSQSSVLHLRIPLLNTSMKMINDLADRLLENNIKMLYGNIKIVVLPTNYVNPYENLQFESYLCNYAWHMVTSLGESVIIILIFNS